MGLGLEILALLFACALVIGCLDAISGSGGLLTVPLLLSLGFDPAHALATNKLQGVFGTGSSTFAFARSGVLDVRAMAPAIPCAAIGAALGTLTVQHVDPSLLRPMIPVFLIGVALYFMLMRPTRAGSNRPPLIAMELSGDYGAAWTRTEKRHRTYKTPQLCQQCRVAAVFVLGGKVVWPLGSQWRQAR